MLLIKGSATRTADRVPCDEYCAPSDVAKGGACNGFYVDRAAHNNYIVMAHIVVAFIVMDNGFCVQRAVCNNCCAASSERQVLCN